MKVRYGNYRVDGVNMTGKEVEMTEDEARPLIMSNIVTPVIETASIEPTENAMRKRAKPRRRNGNKTKNRSHG